MLPYVYKQAFIIAGVRISQKLKRCDEKPSAHYFYMKTEKTVDFHICIIVPLNNTWFSLLANYEVLKLRVQSKLSGQISMGNQSVYIKVGFLWKEAELELDLVLFSAPFVFRHIFSLFHIRSLASKCFTS